MQKRRRLSKGPPESEVRVATEPPREPRRLGGVRYNTDEKRIPTTVTKSRAIINQIEGARLAVASTMNILPLLLTHRQYTATAYDDEAESFRN